MNADQKKRAKIAIKKWWAADSSKSVLSTGYEISELLQELVDAPATEPVARVTGYYAGYLSIATVDGRVLPAGTALYAAPPHQSEHHLEMVNTPAPTPAESPADVARDAERWQMLPAFLAEFQVPYLQLVDKIDAAIERQGGE